MWNQPRKKPLNSGAIKAPSFTGFHSTLQMFIMWWCHTLGNSTAYLCPICCPRQQKWNNLSPDWVFVLMILQVWLPLMEHLQQPMRADQMLSRNSPFWKRRHLRQVCGLALEPNPLVEKDWNVENWLTIVSCAARLSSKLCLGPQLVVFLAAALLVWTLIH